MAAAAADEAANPLLVLDHRVSKTSWMVQHADQPDAYSPFSEADSARVEKEHVQHEAREGSAAAAPPREEDEVLVFGERFVVRLQSRVMLPPS